MFKVSGLYLAITFLAGMPFLAHLGAEERDPFVSLIDIQQEKLTVAKTRVDLSKVILKGILWNAVKPVAIVDDELISPGDNWGGFKVERIDKDRVILSDGEKSYPLFIPEVSSFSPSESTTAENNQQPEDRGSVYYYNPGYP